MFSVRWKVSCHDGGGEIRAIVTKWRMGEEEGSKIGQKSVKYYLNGPFPD